MMTWQLPIIRATEEFIEALSQRGFRVADRNGRFYGSIQMQDGSRREIAISLREGFPYVAPKVQPIGPESKRASWHQERDGSLCLWPTDAPMPWMHADALLDRVRQWFERSAAGWPNDQPDLDLERYFDRVDGFVVYRNLDALVGRRLRLSTRGPVIRVEGAIDANRKIDGKAYGGWAARLGTLVQPVYDWNSIEYAFGGKASGIVEEIRAGKGHLLLLQYDRGPHAAAIALQATRGSPVSLRAYQVADESPATLRLRAGADAVTLSDKSVAIIGIGAVGSLLADLLSRCGINQLLLQDGQVLRPGNCVRHFAGKEFVGWNKALAVKNAMAAARHVDPRQVTAVGTALLLPDDGHRLMLQRDLVVDATADGPTTSMLGGLSQATGRALLSVCVQREGGIVRCDRWPLREGEAHQPPVPARDETVISREGGCGDPVSLTPPSAVLAAAELACRMAVDVLTGARRLPATLIHVLSAQPDAPYDRVSVLG